MEKMWMKAVILTAVCLSLSACGKSKDGSSVTAAAAPAPTDAPKEAGQNTDNSDKDKKDQIADKKVDDKKSELQNKNKKDQVVQKKSQVEAPKIQIVEAKSEQRYTGSAEDYLRDYLQMKEDQVKDSKAKARNQALAQSIRSASLKIDFNVTGDVQASLSLGSSEKNQKTLVLGGSLDGNREAQLRSADGKTKAALKCMDRVNLGEAKTCETSMMLVKTKSAQASLIFRRTDINMVAHFPDHRCASQECEDFYTLFAQSGIGIKDVKSFTKEKMESFEVINGRSFFRVVAVTRGKDVLAIGGPLVSRGDQSLMNIPADRTLRPQDLVDVDGLDHYKTNMQSALNDVRIVGNDGKGNIQLLVKTKVLQDGVQDSFDIEIKRISKSLINIIDSASLK